MANPRRRIRSFTDETEQAPPPESGPQEATAAGPEPDAEVQVPQTPAAEVPAPDLSDTWPDLAENTRGSMGLIREAVTDYLTIDKVDAYLQGHGAGKNDSECASAPAVSTANIGRYARQYGIQDGLTLPEGEEMPAPESLTPTQTEIDMFGHPGAARDYRLGAWLAERLTDDKGERPFAGNLKTVIENVPHVVRANIAGGHVSAPGPDELAPESPSLEGPADDVLAPPLPETLATAFLDPNHALAIRALEESRKSGIAELQAIVDGHAHNQPTQQPATQGNVGPAGVMAGVGAGIGAIGKGIGALLSLPKGALDRRSINKAVNRGNLVYGRSYSDLIESTNEAFRARAGLSDTVNRFNTTLKAVPGGAELIGSLEQTAISRFGDANEDGGMARLRSLLHGHDRSPDIMELRENIGAIFETNPSMKSMMTDIEAGCNRLSVSMSKVEDGLDKLERNKAYLKHGEALRKGLSSMSVDNPIISPPGSRLDEIKEQVKKLAECISEAVERVIQRVVMALTGRAGPSGP